MTYGENQLRQFYVVDSTHTATPKVSAAANKFYVKYVDAKRYGDNSAGAEFVTDKISKGCIRDIRISKPKGLTLKTWKVVLDSSVNSGAPVVGEDYIINFDFRNVFGFGENDRYYKNAVVHVTSATNTAEKFYEAMAANINKQFKTEAWKPIKAYSDANAEGTVGGISLASVLDSNVKSVSVTTASDSTESVTASLNTTTGVLSVAIKYATGSTASTLNTTFAAANITNLSGKKLGDYVTVTNVGTKSAVSTAVTLGNVLTIVEEAPVIDIVRGYYGLGLDMTVSFDPITVSGNETDWVAGLTERADGLIKYLDPDPALSTTLANGHIVADMEYFFSKGRADIYGFMGYPDINPSEMIANKNSDYYILDIKYYFQDNGMLNQNSEKELTFACTDLSTLKNIIYDSNTAGNRIVSSANGSAVSGSANETLLYTVTF